MTLAQNGGTERDSSSDVNFRVHARALAALGRDLVTDDAVAVMELVKNSYDALATRVDIRVRPDGDSSAERDAGDDGGANAEGSSSAKDGYIEIFDNGTGMDLDTIRDVWCVIATPSRAERPVSVGAGRARAVTGEKGLGRLAAGRLGDELRVRTRTANGPTYEFALTWSNIFEFQDMGDVGITVTRLADGEFDSASGTSIRIGSLRSDWDEDKVIELSKNLARLVPPFGDEDFVIRIESPGRDGAVNLRNVRAPDFLSEPKYSIAGKVEADGSIQWRYRYRPIGGKGGRDDARLDESLRIEKAEHLCGPFGFEIRAWDLSLNDTRDMAEHYQEVRSRIRGLIREHRGISVYRDDVLVLPKSERARDWLGLDLRRVSRVGPRLSTSQVVGNVRLTKSGNPNVVDTSDRERLVDNPAFEEFRKRLFRVVEILENERISDRENEDRNQSSKDLFAHVTAEPLISQLESLREEGAGVEDAISVTQTFAEKLEKARSDIERRFGYYNRLAVVGTVAQVVIHEIRNQITVIGRGLRKASAAAEKYDDKALGRAVDLADGSAESLESLARRFAPLARRGYRLSRRTSVLEDAIGRCCKMLESELRSRSISVEKPGSTNTRVQIDPGELDAVIINLMTNSIYWMSQRKTDRRMRFRVEPALAVGRVNVSVDDSGPGVDTRDRDLVFRPGWTRKPSGIGMGLVVASEMVEDRGGKMRTSIPGELGGATFEFDLPLANVSTAGGR